jgi:hypothetical protein
VTDALTFVAPGTIYAKRFIGYDGNLCGAGLKAAGVACFDAGAGEMVTVYGPGNVVLVVAGGAFSAGSRLASDANGKAVAIGTGVYNGLALGSAGQDGDVVLVLVG